MTMPVWKGEGNPVEMWLLQLDLANHSRWTHELNSYPDAFRHRREFAHAVEAALAQHDFCRLAWAGDGGVFAADGRKSVTSAIEGATSVHETFQGWRNTARLSDCLGIHVSVHRALVTTADDPSYCFGMDLNEFVKRERDLRDQSADHTTTITSAVFRLLTHEQQTGWVLLSESVGTLGRVFSLATNRQSFDWFVGSWFAEPSHTWAYAALDALGDPFVVYCYSGDDEHVGSYENLRWHDGDLVGTFTWVRAPITGHFRLAPAANRRSMDAAWWYAEDVPGGTAPPMGAPGAVPNLWHKVDEKEPPSWAREAIAERQAFPVCQSEPAAEHDHLKLRRQ